MNKEIINERILKINQAIEVAQTDKELADLDNQLEILELARIEMEMRENEN